MDPKPDFTPSHISTFMGGNFKLPKDKITTAGELADFFRACATEVDSWGADTPLSEVYINRGAIEVTLETGIVE